MEPPNFDDLSVDDLRKAVNQLRKARGHTLEQVMKFSPNPEQRNHHSSNLGSWLRGKIERNSLIPLARAYLRQNSSITPETGPNSSISSPLNSFSTSTPSSSPVPSTRKRAAPRSKDNGMNSDGQETIILVHFDGDEHFLDTLITSLKKAVAQVFKGRSVELPPDSTQEQRNFIFKSISSSLDSQIVTEEGFYEMISRSVQRPQRLAFSASVSPTSVTSEDIYTQILQRKSVHSIVALPFHNAAPECRFFVLWLKTHSQSSTMEEEIRNVIQNLIGVDILPQPNPPTTHSSSSSSALPPRPDQIFESQHRVAQIIFEKIFPHFVGKTAFDFRIIVPPRLSLESQTASRLCSSGIFPDKDSKTLQLRVSKALIPSDWEESTTQAAIDWRMFNCQVEQNPDTLFLVIQDECHWGINKKGYVDRLIKSLLKHKNVILLHVSATPENLLVQGSSIASDHVIRWTSCFSPEENAKHPYQGLDKLFPQSYFVEPNKTFERILNLVTENKVLNRDKADLGSLALTIDYALALFTIATRSNPAHQTCSSPTQDVLRAVVESKKMAVVRLRNRESATLFCDTLRDIRDRLNLKYSFDIILDIGNDALTLEPHFHEVFCQNYDIQKKPRSKSVQQPTQYTQLFGIPCIIAIVEKGRMGDTFPDSFAFFDLRARYTKSLPTHSSLIQDIGRAFGYGLRPKVLMSKFGYGIVETLASGNAENVRINLDRYVKASGASLEQEDEEEEVDAEKQEDRFESEIFDLLCYTHSKNHMHYGIDEVDQVAIRERAYMLFAKPQIGKTGAFLSLLEKCKRYFDGLQPPKSITSGGSISAGITREEWESQAVARAQSNDFPDACRQICTWIDQYQSKVNKVIRIAEVGCGKGELASHILQGDAQKRHVRLLLSYSFPYVGIDYFQPRTDAAVSASNSRFFGVDITQPLPSTLGKFDIVIFCLPSGVSKANAVPSIKAALGKLELGGEFLAILTLDQYKQFGNDWKQELAKVGFKSPFVSTDKNIVCVRAKLM